MLLKVFAGLPQALKPVGTSLPADKGLKDGVDGMQA